MRVQWIPLDEPGPNSVQVGDVVSAEAGGMPLYRVLAIDGGIARLRDSEGHGDRVAALDCFHWKACAD